MKWFGRILRTGNTYACVAGDHVGKILIFLEKNDTDYGFLTIPNMENLWVPVEKFDFGLKNGIVEYIERVPKHVRQIADHQFQQNKQDLPQLQSSG